jgi:shikimate dehydrogenase
MNNPIDRYAVFGNPIKHSKSPQIHTMFAEQTGQSLIYSAELAEIGKFSEAVQRFLKNNGKGLNVTVPFKEDAWKLADTHSERAELAGAVNTIKLEDDGRLFGDTTDGTGLVHDLIKNHHVVIEGKNILIIGAGGAVRGVLQAFLEQKPASILITNRTAEKAVQLANDFSTLATRHDSTIDGCGLDELDNRSFDIVINGTSASLQGELPPIPGTIFNQHACSYDMMYGAQDTVFMQWSKDNGAKNVLDGLGMLVEQAAEAFYIWRGVMPETAPVIKHIRKMLIQAQNNAE